MMSRVLMMWLRQICAGFYEDANTLRSEVEACLRRINSDIYLKYHQLLKFEFTSIYACLVSCSDSSANLPHIQQI